MPERYHIHTHPVKPRVQPVGKLGIVDWREDCAGCHNCVKRGCIYGLYRDEAETLHDTRHFLDYVYQCKGCLSCIQNCTKALLTRVVNPEFEQMGDEYYTPDIILITWFTAETARIPVSGAGYGGPFAGEGFDAMWTDMSEIVRPTRDGIHGREYISTVVDIGCKPPYLKFEDGKLVSDAPPLIQAPLPALIDRMPAPWESARLYEAIVEATRRTETWAIVPVEMITEETSPPVNQVIPLISGEIDESARELAAAAKMVEITDGPAALDTAATLKAANPDVIVGFRVTVEAGCADRAAELAGAGAEVIHLLFDPHGRERGVESPRHAREVLREVHGRLLEEGIRDEVTLISTGGVALAEHMAKAIICGADLIAIDLPVIIALECRLCRRCERNGGCPAELSAADREYSAGRMTNLFAAWHLQLLEVLGAMGIREVRRLRGECGRAMFKDELEREIFAPIFGNGRS